MDKEPQSGRATVCPNPERHKVELKAEVDEAFFVRLGAFGGQEPIRVWLFGNRVLTIAPNGEHRI